MWYLRYGPGKYQCPFATSNRDPLSGHVLDTCSGMSGYSACCISLAQLTEDEPHDPEAPEQMARHQQRALKRDSAQRIALVAAGIGYE
eukprot:jgi/Tetstr1/436483/TSEL_025311.t1